MKRFGGSRKKQRICFQFFNSIRPKENDEASRVRVKTKQRSKAKLRTIDHFLTSISFMRCDGYMMRIDFNETTQKTRREEIPFPFTEHCHRVCSRQSLLISAVVISSPFEGPLCVELPHIAKGKGRDWQSRSFRVASELPDKRDRLVEKQQRSDKSNPSRSLGSFC